MGCLILLMLAYVLHLQIDEVSFCLGVLALYLWDR